MFGGRGITQSGMGRLIEHVRCVATVLCYVIDSRMLDSTIAPYHSTVCLEEVWTHDSFAAHNSLRLLAAEDVLADLGVRQAMRGMPKNARL